MKITIEHEGYEIEIPAEAVRKFEIRTAHHAEGAGITLEAPGDFEWAEA